MATPMVIHMPKFYSDVILAPIGLIALAIPAAIPAILLRVLVEDVLRPSDAQL